MPPYQYEPLSEAKREIRLIRFKISQRPQVDLDDTIEVCLEHVSLSDNPEYNALSYVWGDDERRALILVNGCELRVTASLHVALRQQIDTKGTKKLWVDALCINQERNEEKDWQIEQMRDIFESAATVFIWLGPSAEDSAQAMDQLESIGVKAAKIELPRLLDESSPSRNALVLRLSSILDRNTPQALEEGSVDSLILELNNSATFRSASMQAAIRALLLRRLWRRAWIVQEITLSREAFIVCGDRSIPIENFDAALACIIICQESLWVVRNNGDECFPLLEPSLLHARALLHRRRRKQGQKPRLATLLMHQHRRAPKEGFLFSKEPRDLILGQLGIAGDTDGLSLKGFSSKSTEDVFTQFTRAFLKVCPWYRLEYCTFPKQTPGLPSWVPDFVKIGAEGTQCNPLSLWGLFSASLHKIQPKPPSSLDWTTSKVLPRLGSRADIVTSIMEPAEWIHLGVPHGPRLKNRYAWLKAVEEFGGLRLPLHSQEELLCTLVAETQQSRGERSYCRIDKTWKELSRNIFRDEEDVITGFTNEQIAQFKADWPFFNQIWQGQPGVEQSEEQKKLQVHARSVLSWAEQINHGRTLFKTTAGRLGLGPKNMLAGDIVTIIYGTKVPIILHPTYQACYEFVGEAYTHGIMDGEFMATNPFEEIFELI